MIPINILDSKIIDEHYEGICKYFSPDKLIEINDWLSQYNLDFEKLIKAKPGELRSIKKRIKTGKSANWQSQIPELIKDTYSNFSKYSQNKYCGVNLIANLQIKVCPYCNRSFIHNFKKDEKIKRSSQTDHFFPKGSGKYPYLALSFFNLIPSCYSCNHAKGESKIDLSPYEISSADDVLTFGWKPKDAAFNYPKGNVEITPNVKPEYKEQMQSNVDVFGLKELYDHHDDIVKEMLLKGEIYSPDYIQSLVEQFPDLIENEEEALRIVTGNYTEDEDLGKRPLSKLTRDIARDVGFLKNKKA